MPPKRGSEISSIPRTLKYGENQRLLILLALRESSTVTQTMPPLAQTNRSRGWKGGGKIGGTVREKLAPWNDHGLGAGEVMEMGRYITAVMGYRACKMPAPRKPDLCSSAVQAPAHPYLLKPEQLKFFWVIMSLRSREKNVSLKQAKCLSSVI